MTAVSGDLQTARNATIDELLVLLRDQQARKVDVVASASSVRAEGGCLVLDGTTPVLGADGVTMTTGRYRPTDVCDAGIADKLGIPAAYLRKTRDCHPALFDRQVRHCCSQHARWFGRVARRQNYWPLLKTRKKAASGSFRAAGSWLLMSLVLLLIFSHLHYSATA